MNPPPAPIPLRWLVGVVSVVVGVSALVGAAEVLRRGPIWLSFGFEAIVVVAAVFGVLAALRKFAAGPAMAMACVGGTVFVASVLGYLASQGNLGGLNVRPLLAARVGAAGLIGLAAALTVLAREPRSWRPAALAALLAAPVLVIGLLAAAPSGRAMLLSLVPASAMLRVFGTMVGFLIFTALCAASVHLGVKAFEMGRPGGGGRTPGPPQH